MTDVGGIDTLVQPSNKNKYAAGKPVSPEDIANVYERLVQVQISCHFENDLEGDR